MIVAAKIVEADKDERVGPNDRLSVLGRSSISPFDKYPIFEEIGILRARAHSHLI